MDKREFEAINSLVESDNATETQCRQYVEHGLDMLVPHTTSSVTILNGHEELLGASGPSDLIITADVDEFGQTRKVAYVWEIKGPNEAVFQRCNNNRIKPTREYVKAENQLLHYWDDCHGSDSFRAAYEFIDKDDIRLGGVLISKFDSLVSGSFSNEERKTALLRRALRLRIKKLYTPCRIQLVFWDELVRHMKSKVTGA